MQKNKLLRELLNQLGCKITFGSPDMTVGELTDLYIRIFTKKDSIIIQFSVKETFDRWSNSVNFTSRWSNDRQHYKPCVQPQINWIRKVVKSKLFDFNSYFSPIDLPWFTSFK